MLKIPKAPNFLGAFAGCSMKIDALENYLEQPISLA